jgi:hypothetical protein
VDASSNGLWGKTVTVAVQLHNDDEYNLVPSLNPKQAILVWFFVFVLFFVFSVFSFFRFFRFFVFFVFSFFSFFRFFRFFVFFVFFVFSFLFLYFVCLLFFCLFFIYIFKKQGTTSVTTNAQGLAVFQDLSFVAGVETSYDIIFTCDSTSVVNTVFLNSNSM